MQMYRLAHQLDGDQISLHTARKRALEQFGVWLGGSRDESASIQNMSPGARRASRLSHEGGTRPLMDSGGGRHAVSSPKLGATAQDAREPLNSCGGWLKSLPTSPTRQ
jgi:hypothetical protein